jgi:uncharacterized peroxidase-related enzyme
MAWIETISVAAARGNLRELYERVLRPDGDVDNILKLHSLRPHTLEAHMAIYKRVLHHSGNTLPRWLLEAIGVYVSLLNGCGYCVEHHAAGLARLLGDPNRAAAMRKALAESRLADAFGPRERAALDYACALTLRPAEASAAQIEALRAAGFSDGEILEINQVTAYFAYANRTVLGLGGSTEGDVLGLSPSDSDDPDNWAHR